MAKAKSRGQRKRAPVWDTVYVDTEGRKRTQGVLGDLEHAELMLDDRLEMLTEWAFPELNRLAETIRAYAIGHELIALRERVDKLEARRRRNARSRDRRAA